MVKRMYHIYRNRKLGGFTIKEDDAIVNHIYWFVLEQGIFQAPHGGLSGQSYIITDGYMDYSAISDGKKEKMFEILNNNQCFDRAKTFPYDFYNFIREEQRENALIVGAYNNIFLQNIIRN